MKYNIYIQDIFKQTIEADDTTDALKIVGGKISSREFIFDESKPHTVKIEPKND